MPRPRCADQELLPAPRHHYAVVVVALSVHWLVHCHLSLRSISAVWASLQASWPVGVPCAETIRWWFLRLGLFLVQQPLPPRADWVWIVDHSIQAGTSKCLVILGVTLAALREVGFCLDQNAVQVLKVDIVQHSTGALVAEQLAALAQQVGVPHAIVSDHGSDLRKGIALFQVDQPEVRDVYDVTHRLACLLQHYLEPDPRWAEFVRQCAATANQLRQTLGSFLMPPTFRAKARYLNADTHVAWGRKILALEEAGAWSRLGEALDLSAAEAHAWFTAKLGWVRAYRTELQTYQELLRLAQVARDLVRTEGLSAASVARYQERLGVVQGADVRVQQMVADVQDYLASEGAKAAPGQPLLGSSEVLESTFGSYKTYLERSPRSEIGANLLFLVLLVSRWGQEQIQGALTTVGVQEVRAWIADQVGTSRQQRAGQVLESLGSVRNCSPAAEPRTASLEQPGTGSGNQASGGEGKERAPPEGRKAA